MLFRLFLLFTLVPLLELFLLLEIGGLIGLVPTLLLVLGTGAAGAWMARREGVRSWVAVRSELAAGRFPAEELLHSLLILVAGVVLVTPGVLTDATGLLLLVRPLRASLIRGVRGRFEERLASGGLGIGSDRSFVFTWWGQGGPGTGRGPDARPDGGARGELEADRPTLDDAGRGRARGAEEADDADDAEGARRRPRVIEM